MLPNNNNTDDERYVSTYQEKYITVNADVKKCLIDLCDYIFTVVDTFQEEPVELRARIKQFRYDFQSTERNLRLLEKVKQCIKNDSDMMMYVKRIDSATRQADIIELKLRKLMNKEEVNKFVLQHSVNDISLGL